MSYYYKMICLFMDTKDEDSIKSYNFYYRSHKELIPKQVKEKFLEGININHPELMFSDVIECKEIKEDEFNNFMFLT